MNLTRDKVFIDTNILIYCYTDLFPVKQKQSLDLLENLSEIIISTQVVNEFANTFLKKIQS